MPSTRKAKYILEAEDRTKLALKNAERNFQRVGKTVAKMFGPIAALASGAGLASFVNETLAAADALAKTSDRLGLTTDQLQELNFAAERSGLSTDQLTSSMTAFVKRVGEANQNTGPLVAFLKKYDEELLKSIQTAESQEKALELVAEAIRNAESATDKAAIANAAFSRSGIGMVNMLSDGKFGLDELRQSARDAGVVLEENLLRTAEDINDEWDELIDTLSTKFKRAALIAAKTARDLFTSVQNADYDQLIQKRLEAMRQLEAASQSAGGLNYKDYPGVVAQHPQVKRFKAEIAEIDRLIELRYEQEQKRKALLNPSDNIEGPPDVDKPDVDIRVPKRVKVDPFLAALEGMQRQVGLLGTTTQYEKTLWEIQNGRYKSLNENQQKALLGAAALLDARTSEFEQKQQTKDLDLELDKEAQAWRDLLNPMEEVDAQLVRLDLLLAEGKISWETYAEGVFHTMEGMDDMQEKTKETASELSVFADEAARNMQSAFADFLFDPFDKGLDGMLRSFVQTLHRMASEALAAGIFDALLGNRGTGQTGVLQGFFGALVGSFHDGGIVGQGGSKTMVNPLVFAGAPRYHSGGIAGLSADEVPAILQRGELVIPRDKVGTSAPVINMRMINTFDQDEVVGGFMSSPAGEKVFLNSVRRNVSAIRQLLV